VPRKFLLSLAAPVAAVVFSLLISSLILIISGNNPISVFSDMFEFSTRLESIVSTINRAIPLYVSGLAVAVGFRMNLFNIGVEGQYRLAALIAAAVGAAVDLPAPIHIALIVLVAMIVGSAWAGVAGVLKVTRNVHEVISTIMLNFIAVGLIGYLLREHLSDENDVTFNVRTPHLPKSGQLPSLNSWVEAVSREPRGGLTLSSFVFFAIAAGIIYYLLIWRTRLGYDLRATGINPWAAQASGVPPKRTILVAMLISGAFAGLIGMTELLSFSHEFSLDSTSGLGFTGIAVALLGRNHPVGIAVGALLFGYLDRNSQILDLQGIPKEIIAITQAVIILAAVVAYEVVDRIVRAQEARTAASAGPPPSPPPDVTPAAPQPAGSPL
jgi:simple sugar transport system permease protein